MTNPTLAATAAFDRKVFPENGSPVRFLVARVNATLDDDRRPSEREGVNIALSIDASGSMRGGKLEAAKEAALGLAERLTERDRLTVVSFASDVITHLDAVPVNRDNGARIHAEISRLHTRGMTCLSGGWFAGADHVEKLSKQEPGMTPRVIILSDGHANEGIRDPLELREHAGELRMRGVLTSTLGIGNGYDEHLLRSIAENGGGRLHDAEFESEISSILLGELDDIHGTIVENAEIALTAPEGARIEVLGRECSMEPGNRILVPLGPLQNDIGRSTVFKVTCPDAREGEKLKFDMTATGRSVENQSMLNTISPRVALVAATETENAAQERDAEIAEIAAKMWNTHIVTTAARMNGDMAFEDAKNYVESELRAFRDYVQDLEGARFFLDEIEEIALRASHRWDPRMRKEMVYQSSLRRDGRSHRGFDKKGWVDGLRKGA